MKTLIQILTLSLLSFSTLSATNSWEEALRVGLNTCLGSTSFSFEELNIDSNTKTISGTGTFFNKSGITFMASFSSPSKITSFQASFPAHARVGIGEQGFGTMGGSALANMLPSSLSKGAYLNQFRVTFADESSSLKNVQFWFDATGTWPLLPGDHMQMDQIQIHFNIENPTSSSSRNTIGELAGRVKIGSFPVQMTAKLSSQNKEDLELSGRIGKLGLKETIQSIVGKNSLFGLPVPSQVISLSLNDALITVRPKRDWASIDAKSNWGNVNLWVQKEQKMEYMVVISPPKGFRLSKINSNLSALDGLDLSGQKIVFSSAEKEKKESSKVPSLSQVSATIKKGCNLLAKLDVTKLKLEHLLKVKEIVVNSALSDKLEDVVLESELETDIEIGPGNKLKNTIFRLQPSPKDFAVSLIGVMDATVGRDQLKFSGGVEIAVNDQALNFLSMMNGDWNDPLGVNGLVMSNVRMQMGAAIGPTILPNVAFNGELQIGRFKGDAALAFDTRNPSKSMISAQFNELAFLDIVDMLIDKRISKKIPADMKKVLNSIRMRDVNLEAVPQAMRVLEKSYEAGFRAGGEIEIFGVKGMSKVDINYSNGVLVQAEVDPISLGVFKLKGAGSNARPGFLIDLRKGKSPKAAINGLVSLMGLQAETDIEILSNGYRFKVGGKIFNVFNGQITASGQDLNKGGDMYLKVKMENDLLGFVDREVTKFIKNSTGTAIQKITEGQRKINAAQREIAKWEREIRAMRSKVSKEQAADRAKIAKARRDVNNAQKKVNSIQREIDKLKKELKRKNKPYHAPERGYIRAKIAGLYTAKATAWATLEGYEKIVLGLAKKLNTNPDADARVIALKVKKDGAMASLEAAKLFMEGLKKTLGFTGNVATFVVDKGTDMLINVRSAEFEGRLGAISGGAVKMKMQVEWMGKKKNMTVDFDFDSPAKSVGAMAKKLMGK